MVGLVVTILALVLQQQHKGISWLSPSVKAMAGAVAITLAPKADSNFI